MPKYSSELTTKPKVRRSKSVGEESKVKNKRSSPFRRTAILSQLNAVSSGQNLNMAVDDPPRSGSKRNRVSASKESDELGSSRRKKQRTREPETKSVGDTGALTQEKLFIKLKHAANDIVDWMNKQDNYVAGEQIKQALAGLKSKYNLKRASITFQEGKWGISLQINPRLFIPMTTTVISGAKASPSTAIPQGDYLRATRHDGPFNTPIQEIISGWNTHYGAKIKKISINDTKLSKPEASGYTNTSQRPGSVEAVSSVVRGKGRSGSGETAIGHLGRQQQLIMTGAHDADFNGGHLIGDQLLNSHNNFNLYQKWNLAPQHRQFNSPTYSSGLEGPAAKIIKSGNKVQLDVDVRYDRDVEKVATLTVMSNILKPSSKKQGILKKLTTTHTPGSSGLPTTLEFHTRIPRFWSASAKKIAGTGSSFSGSISNRSKGELKSHALSEADDAKFNTGKTYIYSVSTAAGGAPAYLDPSNFNSKGRQSYSGKNEVKISAHQKTYTTQPSKVATGSATTTLSTITPHNSTTWGAKIRSDRVLAIVNWLSSHSSTAGSGLNTLLGAHGGVSGVGPATIKRIKNNGFTL